MSDPRNTWRGDVIRYESAEWLSRSLPGAKAQREALAAALVRALDQHWSVPPAPAIDACRICKGTP